ncbi:hypothetical protein NPIL_161271 [Nephila pilipes]|uniref:Uncharacterized protein n=1 Tax=Nephila pilipes TaxID=299642 RepID=A0A8X6NMR0_NEPPI|nr:hypothetical protein NPIL_161271 [Nephila pilipes]
MITLRGQIAALRKQVERLSKDRLRNRCRRRYGKSPYRSKIPSRREDYHFSKSERLNLRLTFLWYSKSCNITGKQLTLLNAFSEISEISVSGHLVTQQGTKPFSDKVEPILNYPKPKTIKEL